MMRSVALAIVIVFVVALGVAQTDTKAKADAATGADKAKFALEVAEQATKSADSAFKQGKDDEGAAQLREIADYGRIASDAAIQSGKHEKEIEINLRKIVNRLVDIKNARPYDQQDAVQQTIDAVDNARNNLLEEMFKRKH